ncbi:MAG TPA: hypothetical protein VGD45_20555 [Steroidobacter sp.]|uniref:hypothetical protein n=1 Tax=Steroidobacter sp. TaxID=1978227 RepID=UPI002ED90EB6
MPKRVMVEYQGEVMRAEELAKRIGVSQSCIAKRWLKGLRDDALVAPSQKGRPGVPRSFEHRFAAAEAEKIRRAEDAALARRTELRRRAREKAANLALELAAACARPLIDAKLLTTEERIDNQQKVKGRQRWNAGWLGESHESREQGR